MRRYGFTGTDYVVPNFVGRGSFMTWSQVIEADRLGFTIGAHTMNHVALARVPTWRALAEMSQSKTTLEQMVGHPVIEFAYPYGSFNGYLAGRARAMGFESATSTTPGAWHEPGALWWLHRQRVSGWTSLAAFAQLVGGPWPGAPEAAAPPVFTPPAPNPPPGPPAPKRKSAPGFTPTLPTGARLAPSRKSPAPYRPVFVQRRAAPRK
jgi:peptidoglycan/xylan/chitin deacetylase (PgdA/CDA1 family)